MDSYDMIVIGSGPAGQKAAIAAVTAALGVRRARVYALALDADG